MKTDVISARLTAFCNVRRFIDVGAWLPAQVLVGEWSRILFFESEWITSASFVEAIGCLLHAEESTSCCLLNFSQTCVIEYQKASAIFIEAGMSADEYQKKLKEGGPATGWLYRVDRYGCASDIGEWCIYCEQENDVALIGLRSTNIEQFLLPLERLFAKPIETLVENHSSPPPFNMLTCEWRTGLLKHYGRKLGGRKAG